MPNVVSATLPGSTWAAAPMGDDINQRIAEALMMQSFKPQQIQSHSQGLAEVANSALAGMMYRKALDQRMGVAQAMGAAAFPGASPPQAPAGPFGGGILGGIGKLFGGGDSNSPTVPPPSPPVQTASIPPQTATDAAPPAPYSGIAAALADKQTPPVPPADIPNVPQGTPSPDALNPTPLAAQTPPLSGGAAPIGIDRSRYAAELQQNPALAKRLADMVNGEVGLKDPRLAQIELESVFNRAGARGIPLQQALLSVADDPKRGYYASTTYNRPVNPQQLQQFDQTLLPKVLGGSDVGTQALGFAPTGNASDQPGNPFASNRAANGMYDTSKWYSGVPGKGEMFVTEKGDTSRMANNLPKGPIVSPDMLSPNMQMASAFAPSDVASNNPNFVPPQPGQLAPMGNPQINTIPVNPQLSPQGAPPQVPVPPPRPTENPPGYFPMPPQNQPPFGGNQMPVGGPQGAPPPPAPPMPPAPQQSAAPAPYQVAQNGPPVPPPQAPQAPQPQGAINPAIQMIDARLAQMQGAYQQLIQSGNPQGAMWIANQAAQLQQQKMQMLLPQPMTIKPGEQAGMRVFDPSSGQYKFAPMSGTEGNGAGVPNPAEISYLARRANAGDQTVYSNSRGELGQYVNNLVKKRAAEIAMAEGTSPEDMALRQADYQGYVAGAKNLGTRVAQTHLITNEAKGLIDQALEASDANPRTQYMPVNALIQAYQRNTGDPSVIRLGAALYGLAHLYARGVNPSGQMNEGDVTHAYKILEDSLSKGQLAAGIGQINAELNNIKSSAGTTQHEIHDQYKNGIMPGAQPQATQGAPQQPPQAQAPQGPTTPQVGEVRRGYRFMGGNPANPQSWQQVQ